VSRAETGNLQTSSETHDYHGKVKRPLLMERLHKSESGDTLFQSSRFSGLIPFSFGLLVVIVTGTLIYHEIDYVIYSRSMYPTPPDTTLQSDLIDALFNPLIIAELLIFLTASVLVWRGVLCFILPAMIKRVDDDHILVKRRNLLWRMSRTVPLASVSIVQGGLRTYQPRYDNFLDIFLVAGRHAFHIDGMDEMELADKRTVEYAVHVSLHHQTFRHGYCRFRPLLPVFFFG